MAKRITLSVIKVNVGGLYKLHQHVQCLAKCGRKAFRELLK